MARRVYSRGEVIKMGDKTLWPVRGILTVLNTPFDKDLKLDLDALGKNVEHAIQAGVAGFLVPAMASEVDKLTEQERLAMVKTVLDRTHKRVPVIGGASAPTQEQRIAMTRHLIDLGCDCILAQIPFQSEASYTQAVHELANCGPPFLMLQDYAPDTYGLPVPLITKLFEEVPCFRALKVEVVPAGVKYTEVLKATCNQLHVSGGWAVMQLIEALDRGVHAFMPTGMHLIYTRIFALYQAGNREGAKALFERVLPIITFSNQHLDISVHFFKRLLWKEGIYATPLVRPPILPFDQVHARIADDLIDYYLKLKDSVKGHSLDR